MNSKDKIKNKSRKPRSFPNEELVQIGLELPKGMIKKMRLLVIEKETRLNLEMAAAISAHLRKNKEIVG